MSQSDRAIKKLATEIARIRAEVKSWRGAQADFTSIENGGNFTFKDGDGNVTAIVGGQDDGSNTIRHVDGPTPPIPSGLTAHVDGPIVQVSWDGTFESDVTHDWHYLEVLAVGPNNEQLTGTINDLSGGEASLAATSQGDWFITARSVSRAGKRSLDGDAGTVAVELVGLTGAIEAVQASADGKNTIYYSATMPPGVDYSTGDLWFDTSEEGANTASVWDGAQWMSLADARVDVLEAALATLDGAMSELDGRLGTVETDLPQQIEDAQQAAIDAAALDATAKADAAQQAAESVASAAQQAADDALAAINAGESMWEDPGFETSFGPLGSTNPAVVRSTVHAYQGAWSVEYTTNGTGANVYPGYISVPVTPGRTYRLSAAVRSDDGLAFESFFEQRSGGSTVVNAPKLEIAGGVGSFALGDATQTIVDGVTELRFAPLIPAAHNNVAGKKLYLDNFRLTDITESWAMFQEAMTAASDAQTVAGEAKAIAEAAVGAAEGGNTNFFNQSEPSGVGSSVGDRWFQRTATWAITGMWMWDGANWIRQTLNNEVIGNLDAGKITFGYMNGERIQAGSIYADRIVSGLSQNMVPDPGFVSPEINASRLLNNSSSGGTWGIADGVLSCDTNGGTMTNNSNFPLAATSDREAWSAYPGMTMVHRFSARVVGGSATVRGTAYTLRRDGSKVYTPLTPSSFQPITSEWKEYSFSTALGDDITSYSTALQVGKASTGVVEFKAPFSASMVGTTVIEGGSVTTNKLAANVLEVGNLKAGTAAINEAVVNKLFAEAVVAKMVTAEQFIGENAILTGAVTADKMAVGSITAESGIIESLDLGTATVGELDGIRIMGQTVRGEQLSGDAIDGKVITGGTYRTTDGTGQWSDAGLFISQPDGTSMVRFPTDGSPLSLTASDTQIERASIADLDVSYGAVRSGGEFTLASGVTAPASPPELTTGWQKLCTLPKPSQPSDTNTLGYWADGDQWVRAIDVAEIGAIDRIETYDYETGQVVNSFEIGLNPRHGLTVLGDVVYVMGKDYTRPSTEVYMFGYDLNTGARVARWEYTRGIQARNALGNDGTNLIIGSVYNLELWVHRRNPTTGVQVGSDMRSGSNSWPAAGGKDLFGVRISGNDVEVVTSWGGRVYLNSNNALVRKTDSANASGYAGWVLPAHDVSGCVWRVGNPYVVDGVGDVYSGSNLASDTTVEVCFTWFDGVNETTPSPSATVNLPARHSYTMSFPVRAGLQKRIYIRSGSGLWFRTVAPPEFTVTTFTLIPGGSHELPTTNSFPNADPATLKSTNEKFEVKGDGSGHWGPLTFNADGTMTSSQIPEWVPITTFKSGFSAQTWGDVPSYRIWPDGKVEWRGVIAGPMPTTAAGAVFTIPAAARPGRPKNKVVAANGGAVTRVEFGPLSDPTDFLVFPDTAGGTLTWVSIDELYYYLP